MALVFIAYAASVCAFDRPALTQTDQPVRLLRGVSLYKATPGVSIQKNDIVETEAGGAQIEMSSDMMIALAPETQVCIANIETGGVARVELVVLSGWVKLYSKRSAINGPVRIVSPLMQITLDSGSSIIHVSDGKVEMFGEEGAQSVAEIDARGKARRDLKVGREQYAMRMGEQAVRVLPRPPKEFMVSVPMVFRDPLTAVPDRLNGVKVLALKKRETDYSDIAPWLRADLALRKSLVRRYKARLSDATFRKQLDEQLGQSVDWKPILHPPPPPLQTQLPKPAR